MIDGKIVSESPEAAFRAGRQAKIPVPDRRQQRRVRLHADAAAAVDEVLARFGADAR